MARPAEACGDTLARVIEGRVRELDLPEVLRAELIDALLPLRDEPPVHRCRGAGAHVCVRSGACAWQTCLGACGPLVRGSTPQVAYIVGNWHGP